MELQEFKNKLRTLYKVNNIAENLFYIGMLTLLATLPTFFFGSEELAEIPAGLTTILFVVIILILITNFKKHNELKDRIHKHKNLFIFYLNFNKNKKNHTLPMYIPMHFTKLDKFSKKEVLDRFPEKKLKKLKDFNKIHKDKEFLNLLLAKYPTEYHQKIFNTLNKDNFLNYYQNIPQNQSKIEEFLNGTLKKTIA